MANSNSNSPEPRSSVLPSDPFDIAMGKLIGHPNGGATSLAAVNDVDWYGNATQFMIQSVRWSEGTTVFLTQVNAQGSARFILPPKVLAVINRQLDSLSSMVRRRHGKRLAEQRKADGVATVFTPAMRAKALATRKAKAAKRRARKAAKGGAR